MDEGSAIIRLASIFLSVYIIPFVIVPKIARTGSLSWRSRLIINWVLTAAAASLILVVLLWSTSLLGAGGPGASVVGALMLIIVGWGGQYLAFNNALEILRVSLMTEVKEVPPTLVERVKSRSEPPKCAGGVVARRVLIPSFTGAFAVSNRGMPVDPSSAAATHSYSLTFFGLQAYECEGNQPVLRPPARRFAPELLAWICAYGDFPRMKGTSCSKCGSELRAADSVSFGRIEADVALPNVEPFQMVYQGPAFTCPNCWTRQISPPAHCGGIGKALMAALNNAGIKERWQDRLFG